MKSAFTLATSVVLMTLCSTSRAADWVPLVTAGTQDQYSYDRSKLSIKDDEITYWKKVVFASPQNFGGHEVASGLLRERLHCAEHTAKLVSYLYYSASGDTVEYVANHEAEATPIIPDSVGDAYESRLCPLVWQKQEENRIKAEQKAAQAELDALKKADQTAQPVPTPPATPAASGSAPATAPAALPPPQIKEQLY